MILSETNIKNYSIRNKPEKKQIEAFEHEYLREYLDVIRYKFYYFVQSNLSIRGIQLDQNGLYFCKNEKSNKLSPSHRLTVQTPVKATILHFHLDRQLETKVLLICSYIGNPEPLVQFSKDAHELQNATILNEPHESKIIIDLNKIKLEESYYECKIKNRWGEDKRNLLVKIKKPSSGGREDDQSETEERLKQKRKEFDYNTLLSGSLITVVILMMVVCLIFAYTKLNRFCRLRTKNSRGLFRRKAKNNFGFAFYNSTAIDDEDSIVQGSSANNLLLNNMLKSLEFSEDRLELGRVIGQGAYGVVVKGEAIGELLFISIFNYHDT